MKDPKKTILFDFDGVIVDSFDLAFETLKPFFPMEGFDRDYFRSMFDGNFYDSVAKAGAGDFDPQAFFKVYLPAFLKLPSIDGIPHVLKTLSEEYRLAIVSSTYSDPIREWLKTHELDQYFTDVFGADFEKSKEKKMEMIFDRYGIDKDDCVFVTDTIGDIKEANDIEVSTIAVAYGYHDRTHLDKAHPIAIVDTPEELLAQVRGIWRK